MTRRSKRVINITIHDRYFFNDEKQNNDNLQKKISKLKIEGNRLVKEHKEKYGYVRGFKKPVLVLLHNELDGGEERELSAFEINSYRLPI